MHFFTYVHFFFQLTSVADDDNKLRESAQTECDVLLSCGYTKPIALLKRQDIPSIIECVTLHKAILQVLIYIL